ncbi:hypothetical protein PMAYCL1PPCAC_19714, partial [Pristionchus mayeri]
NSIVAWLDKPVEIFSVACVSFSFLKCLAYSEQKDLVGSAGTYFLPAWNIVSASIFFRLWTNEFNSDTEAQGKNDNDEQEEEPVQLSKIDQIRILLGYSLANFHWMLIGTILSMVSAAVSVMLPHYTSLVMNGITSLSAGVDVSQSINILAMLTFANLVLSGVNNGSFSFLSSKIVSTMKKDLFDSIIK